MTAAWAVEIAQAQSDDEQTGRIVAQRLDDGRTEFGWQPTGGERVLPRARYFPTDASVNRWLNSSPVEVDGTEIGRINARLRSDGRIEFAFTPTNGERIAPSARYFPTNARTNRWLRSTEITISAAPAATGFVAVSAGSVHTCAIRASGELECWGDNDRGKADPPAGSFSAVSAGVWHTCAIRDTGTIECWGFNGNGEADAPTSSFSAVSAGPAHTCAIRDTGAIECWGSNDKLEWSEDGDVERAYAGQIDAPTGSFSAVSAGDFHTCAINESGAIECWGSNDDGQTAAPTGSFSAVSAGGAYTCGLRESGAIECWGRNEHRQAATPAGSFSVVSAGGAHTCGLRESGAIGCWGENEQGQTFARTGSFSAVSAGNWHTCAIRESGAIECWGYNFYGQTDAPNP